MALPALLAARGKPELEFMALPALLLAPRGRRPQAGYCYAVVGAGLLRCALDRGGGRRHIIYCRIGSLSPVGQSPLSRASDRAILRFCPRLLNLDRRIWLHTLHVVAGNSVRRDHIGLGPAGGALYFEIESASGDG